METELFFRIMLLSFCVPCLRANTADDNNSMMATTESTAVATTQSYRLSRAYRRGNHDEDYENDEDNDTMEDSKAMVQAKGEYWGGYYDFLINEGSYKFWAVFQLATAALLIYSGFAALYYAKVNPSTTDDYEDDFLRRRRRETSTFFPMDPATFQRIVEALETKK